MSAKKDTSSSTVRILKIGRCLSLSGKSTLTYHVGFKGTADIQFRVADNDGGGFFSNEWVAASDIQKSLSKSALVTAYSLHPAFKGKSANTAGFLLAVLKQEKLIGRSTQNPRAYAATESPAFVAEVQALITKGVDLDPGQLPKKVAAKPVKVATKTPAKPVKEVMAVVPVKAAPAKTAPAKMAPWDKPAKVDAKPVKAPAKPAGKPVKKKA